MAALDAIFDSSTRAAGLGQLQQVLFMAKFMIPT